MGRSTMLGWFYRQEGRRVSAWFGVVVPLLRISLCVEGRIRLNGASWSMKRGLRIFIFNPRTMDRDFFRISGQAIAECDAKISQGARDEDCARAMSLKSLLQKARGERYDLPNTVPDVLTK